MAIPDIELVGQLRVQVARVLEDVRVVCVDSEEVTSENQIASKRDASEDQEARKVVMPIHDEAGILPVGGTLDTEARRI